MILLVFIRWRVAGWGTWRNEGIKQEKGGMRDWEREKKQE